MSNLYIPYCSFVLGLFLIILFSLKVKKIKESENIYYFGMILDSFLATFFCIVAITSIYKGLADTFIVKVANKLECFTIINFSWNLLMYIYKYCYNKNKYFTVYLLINIISLIVLIVLPTNLDINYELNYMVVVGFSVVFTYSLAIICLLTCAIITILNIKKLKEKIVPVFLIIIFLSAVAIIRNIMPEFICMEFLLTLSTLIMYHTIENPDYILLNEYVKNKELLESNIEDKSNILFKITQDVKNPLSDIKNISNSIVSLNNINDMHREAQQLKIISSNLYSMVNNILDISSSYEDYKYNGQEYNIFELFSQIVFLAKERLNDDIKFDYSINKTVPKCLYGDEIRLKQVVCSLLLNETTRNNCAKINLDISCFIKNDNCRLIINVINDGTEMNLNYINGIMDNNKYDKENGEDDKLFVNLKSVKQIVESLGGQFLINSINGGNEFIVILNQQIKELTDFKYINQLSNKITNKKSILIIDDDYLELKNISTQFRKSGYDAIGSVYGRDCIKMLNDNDKYSLILLDDEMPNWSAVEIIKELEKLKLANCPIIVMLDKEKESIKKHYLDDFSFTDYFIKSDIKKEIERIEKHIK